MAKGVALLLVAILMTSTAIGANLIGQASVIDGDTIEIHGTRTAYGASTHPNTINCAVTKIAYAARNPRMRSMHPSHNGLQSANALAGSVRPNGCSMQRRWC